VRGPQTSHSDLQNLQPSADGLLSEVVHFIYHMKFAKSLPMARGPSMRSSASAHSQADIVRDGEVVYLRQRSIWRHAAADGLAAVPLDPGGLQDPVDIGPQLKFMQRALRIQ
jgi:hypothetical protein